MSGFRIFTGGSGDSVREYCFFPVVSRSPFFFPPPNNDEKRPLSLSFLISLPEDFRLLSFFRSSSSLRSPRSSTRLSRPRPPSIVVCSRSSLVLSWDLSAGFPSLIFAAFFASFASSSFLFSFSFSSLPSNDPQLQLDFLGPSGSLSFLSFNFLLSAFLSSVRVGIKDKLSVRVLFPGKGDGCEVISFSDWPGFTL